MAVFPQLSLLLQSQHQSVAMPVSYLSISALTRSTRQSNNWKLTQAPSNSCTHIRRVCHASIGLFQPVKRASNVLFQDIKAATNAVMPTRRDGTCTDVHQQTYTLMLHSNTTHTPITCSYNTASTSARSV